MLKRILDVWYFVAQVLSLLVVITGLLYLYELVSPQLLTPSTVLIAQGAALLLASVALGWVAYNTSKERFWWGAMLFLITGVGMLGVDLPTVPNEHGVPPQDQVKIWVIWSNMLLVVFMITARAPS